MLKSFLSIKKVLALIPLFIILFSCQQRKTIPFPKEIATYPQPQTFPLELTDPQPISWDTLGKGSITPAVFPLDFTKLKGMPFDADGFQPLKEPVISSFNFAALPSTPFTPEINSPVPLNMKMEPLSLPSTTTKYQKFTRVPCSTMGLLEWQQITRINSRVTKLFTDTSGLLWITTNTGGIYRFDGTQLSKIVSSLNTIMGSCFDKDGNLWYIDTKDASSSIIIKVDFKTKQIGKTVLPFRNTSISNAVSDKDGNIWVPGSSTSPPFIINSKKMTYQVLDSKTGLQGTRYYYISFDDKNRIWLGSRGNGIDIIDPPAGKIIHFTMANSLHSDTINVIAQDADKIMWAAGPSGIIDAIDIKNGKIEHYSIKASPEHRRLQIMFDKTGQLWLAGTDGIQIIDLKNNKIRTAGPEQGLQGEITNIIEDKWGRILLANFGSDFQYGKTIYPFKNTPIIATTEDSKGNLWVGTENGLFVIDSSRKTYWPLDTTNGLSNKFIQSVAEQDGKIIIGTNSGYNIYNPVKNKWLRYSKKEGLSADSSIYTFMKDPDNNEWITGPFAGIIKHDAANQWITRLNKKGGLNGNSVMQANVLPDKKIWITTDESGPNIVDLERNTVQFIKNPPGINTNAYKGLTIDSYGKIWITGFSEWGLYMIDPKKKEIAAFTTAEGLAHNSVYSAIDHNKKIYVCTDSKINIITPPEISASHKWEVNTLLHSDNFKKATNSFISDFITREGNYLWGDNGPGIVYELQKDTTKATNLITGLKIMSRETYFTEAGNRPNNDTAKQKMAHSPALWGYTTKGEMTWDSLSGPYNIPVNFSLPHDQNVIQFRFTEISTGRSSDSVTFAYVLTGRGR